MTDYDILILGGVRTAVVERLDRVGKKILVTGNGRCNLMNRNAIPADYNDPDFVRGIFERAGIEDNLTFFRSLGLLTTADSEGRIYPRSYAASSVLDVLRLECARLGVALVCAHRAQTLEKKDGIFLLDQQYRARAVIVACGGKAAPVHGSDGSGYALLRAFGHRITPLHPALVQIRTAQDFVKPLKGLRVHTRLTLTEPDGRTHESAGEVLFTDYGLSGIAVMDLSRHAREGAAITFDLVPELAEDVLFAFLKERQAADPARPLEQFLAGVVHSRIGVRVLQTAVPKKLSCACRFLEDSDLLALVRALKTVTIPVLGTKGYPDAQVTAGGADNSEFTPGLESKHTPGLFACGEVLDVDGKCGGYNLSFAWSSGRIAGRSAAQRILNKGLNPHD